MNSARILGNTNHSRCNAVTRGITQVPVNAFTVYHVLLRTVVAVNVNDSEARGAG